MVFTTELWRGLVADAQKIRSYTIRCAVQSFIDSGYDNATETVFRECAAPIEDWDYIFKGSIGVLLSNYDTTIAINACVAQWFDAKGIRA